MKKKIGDLTLKELLQIEQQNCSKRKGCKGCLFWDYLSLPCDNIGQLNIDVEKGNLDLEQEVEVEEK